MSCPSFPGCASVPLESPSIAGTAPDEQAYLFVELSKPWPAKIKKMQGLVPALRSALKAHRGEDVKLIGTPEITWLDASEEPRALLVRWNGEEAVSRLLPAVPEVVREALTSPPEGERFDCYIVCTHGSRDPCCGLLGVPIYRALTASGGRKVLQVSHLGGHRFAPVVGVFPEWRFYGHLTPESCLEMDKALAARLPFLTGYRGNGRLPERLQVAEAKLWEEHGESLLRVEMLEGDKRRARLLVHLRDGQQEQYLAEFEKFEYEGYKSCENFRKGKLETLKLPRLRSLARITAAVEGNPRPR